MDRFVTRSNRDKNGTKRGRTVFPDQKSSSPKKVKISTKDIPSLQTKIGERKLELEHSDVPAFTNKNKTATLDCNEHIEPGEKQMVSIEKKTSPCLEGSVKESRKPNETESTQHAQSRVPKWRTIKAENLLCDMCMLYTHSEAEALLQACERELEYNSGRLAQVRIYGQWKDIPRKQVAHGDDGLSYNFSNNSIPARPWTALLQGIRRKIEQFTGHRFNFVLINRYQNGGDHMGEHRDDEADLVTESPIASLSLGQPRDFIFRHKDARGKNATRSIDPVKMTLSNGSLLMMKYPTNQYWYHSLPKRKNALGVRINMTFRDMVINKNKK